MSKRVKLSDFNHDDKNFNKHTDSGMDLLDLSVEKVGIIESITVSSDDKVISGNARKEIISKRFIESEPIVVETDGTRPVILKRTDIKSETKEFFEAAILANTVSKHNINLDLEKIQEVAVEEYQIDVEELGLDVPDFGTDEGELKNEDKEAQAVQKLEDRFIVPPFSILNAREGKWQERKKYWKDLIKDTGITRDTGNQTNTRYRSVDGFSAAREDENVGSVLDPVLSEIILKWFGLNNSNTFDCFSGDTVFGYVSSYLGNSFTGIELRKSQVDFNNERTKGFNAKYICDDGRNVLNYIDENSQDLLFSCPPYFDLEVYSGLENDASNQKEYKDFLKILNSAFSNAIKCLKDNRFAVIVCGDVRDKKGNYYRFPDHIKEIFENNGMPLYNELILIDPVGNLQMRVGKYMEHRKVGKTHQNVLVFYKGNTKKIKEIYPKIEIIEDEGDNA